MKYENPALTNEEVQFYRDLNVVFNEPFINEMLVKYAQKEYNKAINVLKTAKEPNLLYKAQGEAEAWEKLMKTKEFVNTVLKQRG